MPQGSVPTVYRIVESPPPPAQKAAARSPRKKALLIGINYVGQSAELSGCVNDIVDMRAVCASLQYDEVCVLYDGRWSGVFDPADARLGSTKPTRANITAGFRWLVADAGKGDMLLLHYSGHGGQLRARIAGSELDALDETLVPVDYEATGMMRDDELRALLVDPLRQTGAALRGVLDCCHSGTGMDLRYNVKFTSSIWEGTLRSEPSGPAGGSFESQLHALVSKLTADVVRSELSSWFGAAAVEKYMGPAVAEEKFTEWTSEGVETVLSGPSLESRAVPASLVASTPNVLIVSGCADRQTSADASFGGRASGALTHYVLEVLRRPIADAVGGSPSSWPAVTDFLRDLRRRVRAGGFDQTPQISSETPVSASTQLNFA